MSTIGDKADISPNWRDVPWPHPSVQLTIGCSCHIDNDAPTACRHQIRRASAGMEGPFRANPTGPFQFTFLILYWKRKSDA